MRMEEGAWVDAVRRNKGRQLTQTGRGSQNFNEPSFSFHVERKFFKVLRRQHGGIRFFELTAQRKSQMEFTEEETLWLTRACTQVAEAGEVAQRMVTRKNEISLVVYLITNERGKALRIGKFSQKKGQSLIFLGEGNERGWSMLTSTLHAICVNMNTFA
ncbi:hypothetical protein Syun_000905 [Stephania yunnanensis]|uniref:Uncharacterized protein n=1 Tax=Stephania yunnanensis TaxID=152371 RepID=A0AAP0LFM0_9MAGN